jgi:DNA-binding PadR family transcriptional regulator
MNGLEKKARKHLPLTEATFCIVAALAQPRHGYGIILRVEQASHGRVHLGPGTLYGALTKLLQQGLIARTGETEEGGERRKLYVLTDLGREVVRLEMERFVEMASIGRELSQAQGEAHDQ